MNYLGRSIYGPSEGGGGTTPTNPFNQLLNTTNDVRFNSIIGRFLRVGPSAAAPLYELPSAAPTDPNQVILWNGNPQKKAVWRHPFEQDLSVNGQPSFQDLTVAGILNTNTVEVGTGGLTIGTTVGQEYRFTSNGPTGDGCIMYHDGLGDVVWSAPPAYGALTYQPTNGFDPDTNANLWVASTTALETVSMPVGIPYTYNVYRNIIDTNTNATRQGLLFQLPGEYYEIVLSANLNIVGPDGQVMLFIGGALPSLNGDPILTGPLNESLTGYARTGPGCSNASIAITGQHLLGGGSHVWIGLLPEISGQQVHIRSISWPPNQSLNKNSNAQFQAVQAAGYFYIEPNNLKNVVPRDPPYVTDSWIKADPVAEGKLPEWTDAAPGIDQDLYPTSAVNFQRVGVSQGTVTAQDSLRADDAVNFNSNWQTPSTLLPGLFDGRKGWFESRGFGGTDTWFKPGNDILTFHTTQPAPATFITSFENYWFGEGSGFGFGWQRLTFPAASVYQIQDNTAIPNQESSWRLDPASTVNQPQYELIKESGLFQVDWSFSAAFSPQFNGLQTNLICGVFVYTPGAGVVDKTQLSNISNMQNPLTVFPNNALYSTAVGRGFIQVNNGQSIGFFGRMETPLAPTPTNGALYVRTLSVRIKRVSAY